MDWTLKKQSLAGNGVTGRVMHNGVLKDSAVIAGTDGAGVSRSIVISNVAVGDFIDIALDPTGIAGATDDGSDGSLMTVVIRGTPTLTDLVSGNIQSAMQGVNSTAYIRIPFVVTNAASINFLNLRMTYDDGFVAYLNGVNVASRNSQFFQEAVTWNSTATTNRSDADSTQPDDFDITSFAGLLHEGTNVLAIQGLNANANDSDFLILPVLQAINISLGTNAGYFANPTPGAANGPTSTNIGPIIDTASHTPNVPQDNDPLYVTAQVYPSFFAISNVQVIYRVAYSNEVTAPMFDDGLHGDGVAGDGLYGAIIPANASSPGQMVRYYISATDIRTNRSRLPAFDNVVGSPTYNALDSPEYFGTVVFLPQTNSLPMLHWFIVNPAAANTDTGTRCSIFYNGQFLDNVGVTLHGQSSASFPKHSYNFNLNSGYKLEISPDLPKLSDFAVISTWADRTHVRLPLNTETYQKAGVPAHYTFALRVQQNESFFCVADFSEQGNNHYLERIGYDPDGALYKMYNTFTGAAGNEKKTRKYENTDDLQNFYNALVQPDTTARINYIYDNVNLPSMIDFLAVKAVSSDHDCCHKNYYFYRDSNKSGEWFGLPWDFDLSYGHVWVSTFNYFDDLITTNLFVGVGNNNTLFALMWNDPTLKAMWTRRTRTLMDQILQPPGITNTADFLRGRIDYYANQVRADAKLDKIKWGGAVWSSGGPPLYGPANPNNNTDITTNFETELVRLKDFYLPGRRTFLAASLATYGIPNAQPTNVFITLGAIDYNPASANQAQEYIELINTNTFAVDLSGWRVQGAVDFAFAPGTTISGFAAGVTNRLYISPDVKSFRARTTGPRGGQRLVVVGPYNGQLSARGESLVLVNAAGQTNSSITYVGAPSLPQQYLRITEIMYHPPTGGVYDREDNEYIELKNIGPVALNLTGVHFTNGIEFTFTSATVTNLNPGARIVLAKNLAAFTARYPVITNVTGPYLGTLDNSGETIRLDDAVGEKILDFSYNNSWFPMTDGPGLSLVIVNENAPWYTWGDKASWRPSSEFDGTPAGGDAPPLTFAPILVNEVLTHTTFPILDEIELFNPTTNDVDISNWLISDDSFTPKKFRIPGGTTILAGGYLLFTENDFNTGPSAFSFSSKGDEAYLFSGDASGNPNGYFHGFSFDGAQNGVSFGRYLNSQGDEHFIAQSQQHLWLRERAAQGRPRHHLRNSLSPAGRLSGTNVLDNTDDEFVELQNITANAVPLFDPAFPTNTLEAGRCGPLHIPDEREFPQADFSSSSVSILHEPSALAELPRALWTRHECARLRPVVRQLDNSDAKWNSIGPTHRMGRRAVHACRARALHRFAPWDAIADGFGASLQRLVVGAYGNDPTNWIAGAPSPGPRVVGGPPVSSRSSRPTLPFCG